MAHYAGYKGKYGRATLTALVSVKELSSREEVLATAKRDGPQTEWVVRDPYFDNARRHVQDGGDVLPHLRDWALKKRSLKRNARMKSLTFGVVPPYPEFEAHVTTWKNEDGESIDPRYSPVFRLELSDSEADCGREAAQDIPGVSVGAGRQYAHKLGIEIDDVASLWAFINSLVHHADDAFEDNMDEEGEKYLSLASGIMQTLGYDWV